MTNISVLVYLWKGRSFLMELREHDVIDQTVSFLWALLHTRSSLQEIEHDVIESNCSFPLVSWVKLFFLSSRHCFIALSHTIRKHSLKFNLICIPEPFWSCVVWPFSESCPMVFSCTPVGDIWQVSEGRWSHLLHQHQPWNNMKTIGLH